MANIITENNAIRIDNALIPKSSREIILLDNGVRLSNVNKNEFIDLLENETTLNAVAVTKQQMFDFFIANGFKSNSGGGGGDITVDQTYNSNSENPISGKGVSFYKPSIIKDTLGNDLKFWFGTQTEFDAITTKDLNTEYNVFK